MKKQVAELWRKLQECTKEYSENKNINLTEKTNLSKDLKFDSLNEVEFCMTVEETFNISITEDESEKIKTLGDYLSIIKTKKGINNEH